MLEGLTSPEGEATEDFIEIYVQLEGCLQISNVRQAITLTFYGFAKNGFKKITSKIRNQENKSLRSFEELFCNFWHSKRLRSSSIFGDK